LDDESFGGQVDEYSAECKFSKLLELRNVDKICFCELIFVDYNKSSANFASLGWEVSKLIIVNAHIGLIITMKNNLLLLSVPNNVNLFCGSSWWCKMYILFFYEYDLKLLIYNFLIIKYSSSYYFYFARFNPLWKVLIAGLIWPIFTI
jgi:hypothetical protein